jgi:hypothetical protein
MTTHEKLVTALPDLFYAEPLFRAASPDMAKLEAATTLTIDTPGIGLALAFDYYRVEAFATSKDRDKACGITANVDVMYAPITREKLVRDKVALADIGCGYAVDDPYFEDVVTLIFDAAMSRLIEEFGQVPPEKNGKVASVAIPIARVRYTIFAERADNWIQFPIESMTAFEIADDAQAVATMDWLTNFMTLRTSPLPPGASYS